MKKNRQKKLYHWFCILLVACAFSACGKAKHGASESLAVSLELPSGEGELFWYGVEERKLNVQREGKQVANFTWNQGQLVKVELKTGDQISFTGFDSNGRVVVMGQASITEEKKVSIPVRRIL